MGINQKNHRSGNRADDELLEGYRTSTRLHPELQTTEVGVEASGPVRLSVSISVHQWLKPRSQSCSIDGLIEVLAQTATGPTPPDGRDQTLRLRSDTGFRPVVKTNPEGSEIGNSLRFQPAVVECDLHNRLGAHPAGRGDGRRK